MVEWGDTIKSLMLFVLLVAVLVVMRQTDWANMFTQNAETPYTPDTSYSPFDDPSQNSPAAANQPSWLEKFQSLYDRHWMPNNRQMAVSLYNRNWDEDFGFNMSNTWRSHKYLLSATQVNKIENVIRGGEAGEFETDGGKLNINRYRVIYYALRYVGQIAYRYGAGNEDYVLVQSDGSLNVLRDAEGNAVTPNSLDCSAFVKWMYAYCGLCVGNDGVPRETAAEISAAEGSVPISSAPIMYPGDLLFVNDGSEITHVGIFVCYANTSHTYMYVIEEKQLGIDDQHLFFDKASSDTKKEERDKAVGFVCFNKVAVSSGGFNYVASPKCFGTGKESMFSKEYKDTDAGYYVMPSSDQSLFKNPVYPQSYTNVEIVEDPAEQADDDESGNTTEDDEGDDSDNSINKDD